MLKRRIHTKKESFGNIGFMLLFVVLWYSALFRSFRGIDGNMPVTVVLFAVAGLLPLLTAVRSIKNALYYRRLHRQCMAGIPRRGRIVGCSRQMCQSRGSRGRIHTYYEYFLDIEVYDPQTLAVSRIQSEAYAWPVYRVLASPEVEVYTDESGWHYVIDGFQYKKSGREPDILVESAFDREPGEGIGRMIQIVALAVIVLMIFQLLVR